ncbi:FAD-dependent oxidoreductase [Actinomadura viridis]|uniref:Assimilatory nitrate reductase electron transfer subunit n=1 Tax=Actinomadura viridis TaxID=58110 RepID=A0A931DJT3_9ACTN|nr:FAD-dependent oxidoreductase [Actinomadura viridis]MBG6089412.1 assimilatory nitrate reductase electron transfer subunit [Actinomadura viridis]
MTREAVTREAEEPGTVPRGIVVVGNGMAGSRLVSEIRARDPRVPLTVFGAEARRPYNRVLLSNVLAGAARADQIGLVDPAWYETSGVDARLGVEVVRVDREARTVHGSDGSAVPYGTLVIATGSSSFVPPIPGTEGGLPAGAVAFRTLDDCEAIIGAAEGARRAVVIGGGLLGVEAARGLAGRGLEVTVAHLAGHLMDRQLDAGAGKVLARTLGRLGVRARLEAVVTGIRTAPDRDGAARVNGVELAAPGGGAEAAEAAEVLDADLVVLACGVRPEVGLARAAGLEVDRGIVVDETLRSVSDPSVRAIGECSQYGGTVYGLVAPAWEQAAVLADLLTGADALARFTGAREITRLKAAGVDLVAMGETHHGDDDPDVEIIRFADASRGTYKKVAIREGRVIGGILLGETGTAGTLTQLYDRAAPPPADRLSLFFTGVGGARPADSPVRMPDAATVCHCNNVSKGQILECWEKGARTAEEVAARTRASTGCGGCQDTVAGIVDWLAEQDHDGPGQVRVGVGAAPGG